MSNEGQKGEFGDWTTACAECLILRILERPQSRNREFQRTDTDVMRTVNSEEAEAHMHGWISHFSAMRGATTRLAPEEPAGPKSFLRHEKRKHPAISHP